MRSVGRPIGLIRYASLNGIERGERLKFTPRLIGYTVLLAGLGILLTLLLLTRADVQTTLLRAPGALFQQMPNGKFSNLYTLKVVNKTTRELPIELRLEQAEGTIQVMGQALVAPAQKLAEASVLIELASRALTGGKTPIAVGVYSQGRKLDTVKTVFIGPRNDAPAD